MRVVVVAPHPDDETLGCGGTLLKHKHALDEIYLIICTSAGPEYSEEHVKNKFNEIKMANRIYGFVKIFIFKYHATRIDAVALSYIISSLMNVFKKINPDILYIPFSNDIHSDHRVVFNAVSPCTKWFRLPSLKRVLAYETISETEFNVRSESVFSPNVFVNIEEYIDKKIEIMKCYKSEMSESPFPRSEENIRALATFRGSMSGFKSAEAFMLLKEVIA